MYSKKLFLQMSLVAALLLVSAPAWAMTAPVAGSMLYPLYTFFSDIMSGAPGFVIVAIGGLITVITAMKSLWGAIAPLAITIICATAVSVPTWFGMIF